MLECRKGKKTFRQFKKNFSLKATATLNKDARRCAVHAYGLRGLCFWAGAKFAQGHVSLSLDIFVNPCRLLHSTKCCCPSTARKSIRIDGRWLLWSVSWWEVHSYFKFSSYRVSVKPLISQGTSSVITFGIWRTNVTKVMVLKNQNVSAAV